MGAALGLFFIGGLLTTVAPPLLDKSWNKPFENHDAAEGPTGKLVDYTKQQKRGYAIYIREGCKYCHTQQTRTLLEDVKRSGWKGVDSPVSTPDEFVYDYRQTFGTKRTGPDLSRVGGKAATGSPMLSASRSRNSTPMTMPLSMPSAASCSRTKPNVSVADCEPHAAPRTPSPCSASTFTASVLAPPSATLR